MGRRLGGRRLTPACAGRIVTIMRMNLIIGEGRSSSPARALLREAQREGAATAVSAGQGGRSPRPNASRRIWEVDPADLALATGVLLRREDVEHVLERIDHREHQGDREDALRVRLLVGCTVPCALAEAVEHLLEGRTQDVEASLARCPMMQIAEWWSRERDHLSGEELAALLWRLACDPRPQLEPLLSRVGGHLRLRALQLLREEPGSRSRSGEARVPALPWRGATPTSTRPPPVDPPPAQAG